MQTPTTRYLCPLDCGWHHDETPPDFSDPTALHPFIPQDWAAGMDGMAAGFAAGQLAVVEAAVREHLETHPLVEWVAEVARLQRELNAAVAVRPACSGEEGFCDAHGFHRHPVEESLRTYATVADIPLTSGNAPDIEGAGQ